MQLGGVSRRKTESDRERAGVRRGKWRELARNGLRVHRDKKDKREGME